MDKGVVGVQVVNFNTAKKPERAPEYPLNLLAASNRMAQYVINLWVKYHPDFVVIENTQLGRNRHSQRLLEWIHKDVLEALNFYQIKPRYLEPSIWRCALGLRMTKEELKHNRQVKLGEAKGKITKKHLSVRFVNLTYGLNLLLKDNDIADAIGLASAFALMQGKSPGASCST